MRLELAPIYGQLLNEIMDVRYIASSDLDETLKKYIGISEDDLAPLIATAIKTFEVSPDTSLEQLRISSFIEGFIMALFMMKHEFYTGKDNVDDFIRVSSTTSRDDG